MLTVRSFSFCSAVARVLLCVSCLCWCSRQTRCFPKFSLEIHCRKVSNAEVGQLKERVDWKASRATSGAAYFCEVCISGIVDQVGNWPSGVVDQVGNLELSCCGPGWELELSWCRPGGTWYFCFQLSSESFFVVV